AVPVMQAAQAMPAQMPVYRLLHLPPAAAMQNRWFFSRVFDTFLLVAVQAMAGRAVSCPGRKCLKNGCLATFRQTKIASPAGGGWTRVEWGGGQPLLFTDSVIPVEYWR